MTGASKPRAWSFQARKSENATPCPDFLPCPRCTLPRGSSQRAVPLQRVHQHKSHLRWHGDGDSEWAAHVDQQHKQAKAMPCTSACHSSSTRCPIARGMQSFSKAFLRHQIYFRSNHKFSKKKENQIHQAKVHAAACCTNASAPAARLTAAPPSDRRPRCGWAPPPPRPSTRRSLRSALG